MKVVTPKKVLNLVFSSTYVTENKQQSLIDLMSNTVASSRFSGSQPTLYGAGGRKYINRLELVRVLQTAARARREDGLLASTLAMTGARISEVLAVTPNRCQVDEAVIAFVTLKRRSLSIREVPIPAELMRELDAHFRIRAAQLDPALAKRPLWRMHRASAWRVVKILMDIAGVVGAAASPRGLRHGFGVNSLQAGVPITLVQKFMGHSRLSTTSIYLQVTGPEERAFASRYWEWGRRYQARNDTGLGLLQEAA